mmetsp:Transcript_36928/g.98139  ORF Transcript_36928/g.98139 Transcript_36928/m.98139 type:complete len:110 (-) Transcript_36928:2252-2581(-)
MCPSQESAGRRIEDPKMFIGRTPLYLIATHARETLHTASSTCKHDDNNSNAGATSADCAHLELILKLVETKMVPEAESWEERELAAGLIAVWRAVVRGAGRLLLAAQSV